MAKVMIFAALIAAAGAICWFSRNATVPLVFAVFFAVDGAYEVIMAELGGNATLAASAAIAFCFLAWAMDRLSPDS